MKMTSRYLTQIYAFSLAAVLSACTKGTITNVNGTDQIAQNAETVSLYNVNAYPMNKLVCDPWGGTKPPTPQNGIKASLYYLPSTAPRYSKVMDYIEHGIQSEQTLFFNNINVPTRMFSEGFPLQTGGKVKDDLGNELIEYFAMQFETNLQLASDEEEGTYEIAILSDDGSILQLKEPGANDYSTLIDNNLVTPTRMGCANRAIELKHDVKIPLKLSYFQGPRYHIANMLIWRKAAQAGTDSLCGRSGNELFFNPVTGVPNKWTELQSRGWKVIGEKNFVLTSDDVVAQSPRNDYNACYEGTVPLITDFAALETTPVSITLEWNTNIPATAQVLIINTATGEMKITGSDNVLELNHQVTILGLTPQTTYRVQAISISQDLGKGISGALNVSTQ